MEAFAQQLTEVRNLDPKGKYKEQLNQLETEYQFILLPSLDLFHKEMSRSSLLERFHHIKKQLNQLETEYQFILLHSLDLFHKEMGLSNLLERLHVIKEQLCDTNQGYPAYPTNRPFTGLNENLTTCRHCKRSTLRLRQFSNELCCENCGLLEPLDGVAFDYNEIYHCGGDHKVVKRRRTNRSHNFRYYLDKHLKICNQRGYNLSDETIQRTNETFQFIEEHLPTRISMPFVAYKILKEIVPEGSEHVILNYLWLQVPQGSVWKHEEKWQNMLRQFDA